MRHGCIEARDKLLAERDLSADQAWQRAREIARLRAALEQIRDLDYRGNAHQSHYIAKDALTFNDDAAGPET